MSHYHERKEKTCLNCIAELHGRYCHACGQENVEPKESIWGLVSHFFYDITHFDGKFFSTVKYLILKPGFLSREYIRGRRARYLHPIRMYVFTSAFFFIVFFSMYSIDKINTNKQINILEDSSSESLQQAQVIALKDAKTRKDSLEIKKVFNTLSNGPLKITVDSSNKKKGNKSYITFEKTHYKSRTAYDSAQKRLPKKERDGWYKRTKIFKQIEINDKLEKDPDAFIGGWLNKLLHMFPQLLFVSLPIFALLLKLLYNRRRTYYYADHAIFGIHLYIFSFVALLVFFTISKLKDMFHWNWLGFILFGIGLYMLFYTYKAMRNFYQQGRFKTFVKYCLLNFMSLIVILILFVAFFMFSFFQI